MGDLREPAESTDFLFTDQQVMLLKKQQTGEKTKETMGKLKVTIPEWIKNCGDNDVLVAWNCWYCLVLKIYKKLKPSRKKMDKTCRREKEKRCGLAFSTHPSNPYYSCLTFFSRQKNMMIFFIQPWAAKILDLPEINTFLCPPHSPTDVYTKIATSLNDDHEKTP